MQLLVATDSQVVIVAADRGTVTGADGPDDRPTCLAADPLVPARVWCGTRGSGVFRSDDGGHSWAFAGLPGRQIMALAAAPDVIWAGTEPSEIWRTDDGGDSWEHMEGLEALPSSSEWAFPPRPDTHHVRWIASHPSEPERLWVAVEAGALVYTPDGGRTWRDRVTGGPWDTHELAIHPAAPDVLRVAAGDGYFESDDAGATWLAPRAGLEVGYLRSIAIDPGRADTVVISAASGPRSSYVAGVSDGRLYRRVGTGDWERVRDGWPDPADTIAPLLTRGGRDGEIWGADERGLHVSSDGGVKWQQVAAWPSVPNHLRAIVTQTL
jgi:photosystem II stability/assembly factor-like uncharacterized protein